MSASLEVKIFSIQLKGALDGSSSDDLYIYFESQLNSGYTRFLFNFSQVDFITSNGLSTLLKIQNRMKKEIGYSFVFYGVSKEVENVLLMLGLYYKLPIRKTLAEAETYLRSVSQVEKKVGAPDISPVTPDKIKERISFYYSGTPTDIRKNQEGYGSQDLVSQLDPILPEKEVPIQVEIPLVPVSASMETILEEKLLVLRNEIKETLSSELEKRLSIFKQKPIAEIEPRNIPNYIQPKSKQTPVSFEKIFPCEACNRPLRVTRIGKHQCPNCKTEVYVNKSGPARFIEKLNQ